MELLTSKSVVVIGAGPGGEAAAKRAAEKGAQVTLIERASLGGLCLNWGCIPSKVLLEGGRLLRQVRASTVLARGASLSVDWEKLMENKQSIVDMLRKSLDHRLAQLRVRVIKGSARFVSPHEVEVVSEGEVESIPFHTAVIATGSAPWVPPPFDSLTGQVWDSDRMLSLPRPPGKLAVVGGGAVGLEFACLLREVGSAVTVIEKMPQILPGEEAAVTRLLQKSFEKRGITVQTDRTVTHAVRGPEGWTLTLSGGETCCADEVLVCAGRRPSTQGLGLEKAQVFHAGGRVAVNQFLQTSQDHIYAVGDVNGLSLLAHAASAQGRVAVDHAAGSAVAYDNALVPRCLYTWPEVASVGEWTHSAALRDAEVKAQRFFFQGSAKALAAEDSEGFMQILSDKKDGRLLGAQIIGPHATELVHIFSVALSARMTAEQMARVIFAHPTLAEGVREALWK